MYSNWLKYNKNSKKMCVFGLKSEFYNKKEWFFVNKILEMELLDNFKQASKQKEW